MSNDMYHRFANDYAKAIENNAYNAHFERPSLLALLPEVNGKRVLDLACGSGEYSQILSDRGAEVVALDISAEMVAIVKQRFGDKISAYQHDMALGLGQEASGSFDLVICPLAIHYLKQLSPLFSEVKRVLKPDGCFVFSTQHPQVDFSDSPSGNYFQTERLTQVWNTLAEPVEVTLYRRPLSAIFGAIAAAGLCVTELSEGKLTEALQQHAPQDYTRLSKQPCFLFIRCQPLT